MKMISYYLKEKYKNRTVTGISENMKEQKLRERIREEVSNILKEEEVVNIPSNIKTLLGKLEGIGDDFLMLLKKLLKVKLKIFNLNKKRC
jgi:hypothetical protein